MDPGSLDPRAFDHGELVAQVSPGDAGHYAVSWSKDDVRAGTALIQVDGDWLVWHTLLLEPWAQRSGLLKFLTAEVLPRLRKELGVTDVYIPAAPGDTRNIFERYGFTPNGVGFVASTSANGSAVRAARAAR